MLLYREYSCSIIIINNKEIATRVYDTQSVRSDGVEENEEASMVLLGILHLHTKVSN